MREPLATVLRDRERLLKALRAVLPYAEEEEAALWDLSTQDPEIEEFAQQATTALDQARTLIKEMETT